MSYEDEIYDNAKRTMFKESTEAFIIGVGVLLALGNIVIAFFVELEGITANVGWKIHIVFTSILFLIWALTLLFVITAWVIRRMNRSE